jgi:N utilization substance protein B
MATPRDIRRCAIQALFQFDAGNADAEDVVRASLAESPGDDEAHDRGFELARLAWRMHTQADVAVAALSPEWPTHRQPAVDRTILRLAFYEMASGRTPPKVVINEAVDLAKEFSTEKAPMFINGVLDKIYRTMRDPSKHASAESSPSEGGASTEAPSGV